MATETYEQSSVTYETPLVAYNGGSPGVNDILLQVEVAFTSPPGASSFAWIDISPYVRSGSIRRGRQNELDRYEPGVCTLVLSNNDRRFDPTYSSSPYYPYILPMRRMRVTVWFGAVQYVEFTGFIENWPQEYAAQGKEAHVTVTAVDGFKVLAGSTIDEGIEIVPALDRTGARLARVLNILEWPLTDRDIDTGNTDCSEGDIGGVNVLDYAQRVAQTERGIGPFMSKDGKITFRERHAQLRAPYTTVQGIFGDEIY